jgi:hypothetical protein
VGFGRHWAAAWRGLGAIEPQQNKQGMQQPMMLRVVVVVQVVVLAAAVKLLLGLAVATAAAAQCQNGYSLMLVHLIWVTTGSSSSTRL